MRAIRSFTLVLLLATLAVPAVAEEPNGEDSAAARLFREGWWLETGAGALDKASAKYQAALAAEGSTKIRARALYRLGVVLQRMGKTEEGIKALERLTKEFASESQLLAEAQKRLEEWTGQDLKESFGEWYLRYQYSPEFQAKVIDLVLKLGAGHSEFKVRNAAEQELLTIGEPAVAALRAHAASTNRTLATAASRLIFRLGHVPPPEALIVATGWSDNAGQVSRVLEGDASTRLAIRQTLRGDERLGARMLTAAATSRLDLVREFLDQDKTTEPALADLVRWGMDTDVPAELLGRLKALVDDADAQFLRRTHAVAALHPKRGQVTTEEMQRWILSDNRHVRDEALARAGQEGLDRTQLWRLYAELIGKSQNNVSELQRWTSSLLHALRHASEGTDINPARDAVAGRLDWSYVMRALQQNVSYTYKDNPAAVDLLRAVIGSATSGSGANLLKTFTEVTPEPQRAHIELLGWATEAKVERVRARAMREAARRWTGAAETLLAPLAEADARQELVEPLFQGLQQHPGIADLVWSRAAMTKMMAYARATEVRSTSRGGRITTRLGNDATPVFYRIFAASSTRRLFFEVVRTTPEAVPESIAKILPQKFARTAAGVPVGVAILQDSWSSWTTDDQRSAGFGLCLLPTFLQGGRDAVANFALKELERGRDAYSIVIRNMLMEATAAERRTLKAVQAAFDLEDKDQFTTATQYQLRYLPADAATYDAFVRALDKDLPGPVARSFDAHFNRDLAPGEPLADRQKAHIERCLVRGDTTGAQIAINHLNQRSSTDDMPLWHRLLRHQDSSIRSKVARAMGTLYTKDTIAELARLVDDPHPGVRDAALKSLERIKKIEEQKDYWRKFAKDKGK
ncbi:MAG: HEAT repeat domain-containing protein [Planctomycetota bacterium]|nr:HEAT repeat domain-containing protein [Planctomycetota bacterium]